MTDGHLPYLIAAYGLVWLGVLLYAVGLGRRNRKLEREVDELRGLLDRTGEGRPQP